MSVKFIVSLLAAGTWGGLSGMLLPPPISYLVTGAGAVCIALFWDNIWRLCSGK